MITTDKTHAEYSKRPGMTPSLLKHGCRSMKRLKRAIDGEMEPERKAIIIGHAVHAMISGEYEDHYDIMPSYELDPLNLTKTGKLSTSKSTEYYKQSADLWRSKRLLDGKEEITEVEAATAAKIANNVRREFGELIDGSRQELTVTGKIEGVPMRTRLDGLSGTTVWDLKCTGDADVFVFSRIVRNLGYHFSAAVHCELLRQNGIDVEEYLFLVAEVGGDYDVRAVTVPILYLEQQLATVKRVAGEYQRAMLHDTWPGQGNTELFTPNWDMKETDEEFQNYNWEGHKDG